MRPIPSHVSAKIPWHGRPEVQVAEGQTPSKAFEAWIKEIETGVKQKLIPALRANDMLLPDELYTKAGIAPGKPLLQMSDFNGLIALSQKHQAPAFALSDTQLEQVGVVLERTKKSMREFKKLSGKC